MTRWLHILLVFLISSCLIITVGFAEERVSVINLVHQSREKVAAQDLDAALKLAREAVSLDPAFADAWKQQGRVLMLRRDYPEAITSLETALELKPGDHEIPAWILNLLLDLERSQASQLLARWEGDPTRTGVRLAAPALRHMFDGNLTAAEKSLKAASPATEGGRNMLALAWTHLGTLQLRGNRAAKAIDAYQEALRLRPDWVPALRELGFAYRAQGKPALAADAWERGLDRTPDQVSWLLWIAEARSAARQSVTASPVIQRFMASDPAQERGRMLKLALLLMEKGPKEAQPYEEQVRQGPNGQRLVTLAHALAERLGARYAEAARRLEELRRARPDDPELRGLLVETYSQWADHLPLKDKSGPLQKLVALDPKRVNAWRDLGWSLWANKQRDAAIQAWNRALNLEVRQRQTLIVQIVALLAEEGETAQAIELYRQWQPGGSLATLGIQLAQAGRVLAADPILEAAWKEGEDQPRTGLYLAQAKSQKGFCSQVPRYLAPFLARGLGEASSQEVDVLLRTLKTCIDDPGILPLLRKIEPQLVRFPSISQRLGELLELAASERQSLGYTEEALKLYRRLLERDPDRPLVWFQAAELAHLLGLEAEARALLTSTLVRSQSPAVKEGIRGKLAQDQGDFRAAVEHYRRSLASDPQQPEVRLGLFQSLMGAKRFTEARQEADWFIERVARGEVKLKAFLAGIRNALGENGAALQLWRELYLSDPDNPYYAMEMARTLFALCRAKEALEILEPQVSRIPTPRVYELLAEIDGALSRPRRVLEWTEKGLALKVTRRLLTMRVEAADALDEAQIAQEAGEALMNLDRGYVLPTQPMVRALLAQRQTDAAKQFSEALLKRNPEFFLSLVTLKNIASDQGDLKKATEYAKEMVAQRPWDKDASRRLAMAQAEDQQFKPALATLRSLASQSVNQAIPLLIYQEVNPCAYPGRNSSRQVSAHLERLAAEGYQFTVPPDFAPGGEQRQVVVIIVDTEAPALREIDATLRRLGGRAVCALAPLVLEGKVPDPATTRLAKELQASGRWVLASSGPGDRQRLPVDRDGTLGNPLTHTLATPKGNETYAAMAARLRHTLGEAAASLPPGSRTLIYPKGDYGQFSLDTDREALATLKGAVQQSFAAAVAGDDRGFVTPGYDPVRLPGAMVPSAWGEEELMKHLRQNNPYVSSRLDLAKALSWQTQHEEANRWFRRAQGLGADPVELNFNWGANAYFQGDYPTALAKLRRARELDPNSEKIQTMLEHAQLAERPLLGGTFTGWRDTDSRSFLRYGGAFSGYVHDRLQLEVFSDRSRYARTGMGSEDGTRIGGGLLWHFREESWFQGRAWYMDLDNIRGHAGYFATIHLPNPYLSGHLNLVTERDQIDTVEAVRRHILAYRQGIQTYTRIRDTWDFNLDFSYIHRTDGNNTPWVEARIVKRLHEWPFYGIGLLMQFADSNRNPPEYWSPQSMQKYQLYAATRGEYGLLHYSLSARVGPGKEDTTDWRIVWGVRAALDLRLHPRFYISGMYDHLETPTYHRNLFWAGAFFRF
jgi:tetratricopeptide (TPR) repeat protein